MSDAQAIGATNQGQAEQFRVALDASQHFRIGKLIVFQPGVNVCLAFAVEQSGQTEALDESPDFAGCKRFLLQIHHVDCHAALFEEALGGAGGLRVLQTENLHTQHT